MSLIIISGSHEIGSNIDVEYYDNFGNRIPITEDVVWYGGDTVLTITEEYPTFRNQTSVQLLSPIPNYLQVQIGNDISEIFMVNKVKLPEKYESLPVVGNGIGLSKPISDISGLSTKSDNVNRINQSYNLILSTAKGEYPMLPNLGCNLHKITFGIIASDADLESIKQDLLTDLSTQEPRGNIRSLDIGFDYVDTLYIQIEYTIFNTNISGNLLYNQQIGGEVNV